MGFFVIAIAIILYFIPAIVAGQRGHANTGAIIALNLLLGWTFLGWVAAMVWACTNNVRQLTPMPSALSPDLLAQHIAAEVARQRQAEPDR